MEQIKNAWEAPVLEELSLGKDTEANLSGPLDDGFSPTPS